MPAVEPVTRISLKNILLTTDFSEASIAAIPFALAFTELYGAKLWIAHLLPAEPRRQVVFDRFPPEDNRIWQDAEQKLSAFAQIPSLKNTTCHKLVERGDIAAVIPDLVQEHAIDLVVLGTHGRRGVSRLILGSEAEKIYRATPCPVLVVGPSAECEAAKPWGIRRILFPVDLIKDPEPALHYALSLAEERQASIILLHADPLVPWQYRKVVERESLENLRSLIPEDVRPWCEPELMVQWKDPAEAIVGVAQDRGTDLIVMGVHKARGASLSSHLPWPIASEVVGRAQCPVLTVRV